jgi:hypothetical protein
MRADRLQRRRRIHALTLLVAVGLTVLLGALAFLGDS